MEKLLGKLRDSSDLKQHYVQMLLSSAGNHQDIDAISHINE